MRLDITDLFLVGLAFDITGATVLARGLLINPVVISKVAGTFWGGNPTAAMDRCESRVDGLFGVSYLAGGFVLTGDGLRDPAGHRTTGGSGSARLFAALTLAVLALALAACSYLVARDRLRKQTVLAMVRDRDYRDDEGNGPASGEWSADKVKELIGVAQTRWSQEPWERATAPTSSGCSVLKCRTFLANCREPSDCS